MRVISQFILYALKFQKIKKSHQKKEGVKPDEDIAGEDAAIGRAV